MSKATQRGHVDLTDLHRLMVAFGVLAALVVGGVAYGLYRLMPRLAKRIVVTLVLLVALIFWPVVFILYIPCRLWKVPAWYEFKDGVKRLVHLIRVGTL